MTSNVVQFYVSQVTKVAKIVNWLVLFAGPSCK